MSLVARLIERVGEAIGGGAEPSAATEPDERVALAALLVHVARVDGGVGAAERDALVRLMATRFGLAAGAAARLVERADGLDRGVDDLSALIEGLGHGLDEQERRRLLAMAYEVAGADGAVGEFEADLVWRLGRLLGFDDRAIDVIRGAAAGAP